jgi:uncharacterized protein YkwD
MAATPSGQGYWLASADGGVFAYGDAPFLGAQAGRALSAPIVTMASTPSGNGYWMVARDGGVFAYGDAGFLGSPSADDLMAPVVGVLATPSGQGYWLASADGGVFAYGDASFLGSPVGVGQGDVVAITASPGGYRLVTDKGALLSPGEKPPPRAAPTTTAAPAPASTPVMRRVVPTVSRSQPRRSTTSVPQTPAATGEPPPGTPGLPSADEIVAAMNRDRADAGLPPLSYDSRLGSLASGWSSTLARRNTLTHNDLAGILSQKSWSSAYSSLGENLYVGPGGSPGAIEAAWMASPAHRAEILTAGYDRVGIGMTSSGGRLWVTANFANAR